MLTSFKTLFFLADNNIRTIPLYFTEDKKEYINVTINKRTVVYDVLYKYFNDIENKKSQVKEKIEKIEDRSYKNDSCNKYEFTVINVNDSRTRVRLKLHSRIWPYLYINDMKINELDLYYIRNETRQFTDIITRITNKVSKKDKENNKKLFKINGGKGKIIGFISPEDKIKEGEVMIYCGERKAFESKIFKLYKTKIIYKSHAPNSSTFNSIFGLKPTFLSSNPPQSDCTETKFDALWTVILVSSIKEIQIEEKEKRLFLLVLDNSEKIAVRVRNEGEREDWVRKIKGQINKTKVDKQLLNYDKILQLSNKSLFDSFVNLFFKFILSENEIKKKIRGKIHRKMIKFKLIFKRSLILIDDEATKNKMISSYFNIEKGYNFNDKIRYILNEGLLVNKSVLMFKAYLNKISRIAKENVELYQSKIHKIIKYLIFNTNNCFNNNQLFMIKEYIIAKLIIVCDQNYNAVYIK